MVSDDWDKCIKEKYINAKGKMQKPEVNWDRDHEEIVADDFYGCALASSRNFRRLSIWKFEN